MIRQITTIEDYRQAYNLMKEHKFIATKPVEHKSFDEYFDRVNSKHPITFGFFDADEKLMSVLVSSKLGSIPSWFFVLVTTKKTLRFNMSTSGIPELMEATVDYWESHGINSFLYIQSVTHRSYINGEQMKKYLPPDAKFHDYMAPGVTLELLKANTRSKYNLIDSLCQESTFPTDVVIKWTFKKSLVQDY